MMMKKNRFILFYCLLVFTSCGNKNEVGLGNAYVYSGILEATVGIYYSMDGVERVDNSLASNDICLYFTPGTSVAYDGLSESEREHYSEVRKKFGDYNRNDVIELYRFENSPRSHLSSAYLTHGPRCYHEIINSISIIANTDYNEQFPAGSELNGLFTVEYNSVMPYVERGFIGDKISLVSEVCSDIDSKPIRLLCISPMRFTAVEQPTCADCVLQFVFTLDSNRTISIYCTI